MAAPEAARLLERLLNDPGFRAGFDANPAEAARSAGFPDTAKQLARSVDPMQTLDNRESKSSLAGAFLAAAVEGLGAFGDGGHALQPPVPSAQGNLRLVSATVTPDDLEGNLDDEDAGSDEEDGSNEDESDEADAGDAGTDDDPDTDTDDEAATGADAGGETDDDSDEDGSDEEEPDEEEPDEEEPDEEEPDDEEPDEEEPDEDGEGDDSDDEAGDDDEEEGNENDDEEGNENDDAEGGVDYGSSAGGSTMDQGQLPTSGAYPGDDAAKSELAGWMANAAQKRGLPPELPVMASLVESGLKNVNYGDADSLGLFQMRRSIWDQGPYRGYARRPELQLRWFLDHAEAIKRSRQQSGASIGPGSYGEWIADIERPAAQYRGRYQLRLDEARDLLDQARTRSPNTHRGGGNDARVLPVVDSGGGREGLRASIVESAKSFVGTPYVWGGTSPRGFDCSGFVQYVYSRAGIELPRVSFQQANAGTRIPLKDLRPGDLVAWDNSSRNNGADHIAIYVGHGRIAEAPRTGINLRVRLLGLNEGAWGSRVIGRQ